MKCKFRQIECQSYNIEILFVHMKTKLMLLDFPVISNTKYIRSTHKKLGTLNDDRERDFFAYWDILSGKKNFWKPCFDSKSDPGYADHSLTNYCLSPSSQIIVHFYMCNFFSPGYIS